MATNKLETLVCRGVDDGHEPTTMVSEYDGDAMHTESVCPECGVVVVS